MLFEVIVIIVVVLALSIAAIVIGMENNHTIITDVRWGRRFVVSKTTLWLGIKYVRVCVCVIHKIIILRELYI